MNRNFPIAIISIVFVAFFSCENPPTSDPDLVAWWPFDDATSELVPDHSGNHLDGINKGAILVEGKVGKALRFDGNSTVQVDYRKIMDNFPKGITISAWIKKDSLPSWNTVVSREIQTGKSEYFGLAVNKETALFSIDPDGKSYQKVLADDQIQTGVWYHLTGTFDNYSYKLYINGEHIKSGVNEGVISFSDQNPLYIGANSNNQNVSLLDFFKGIIDEVKIYKRALTESEIKGLIE